MIINHVDYTVTPIGGEPFTVCGGFTIREALQEAAERIARPVRFSIRDPGCSIDRWHMASHGWAHKKAFPPLHADNIVLIDGEGWATNSHILIRAEDCDQLDLLWVGVTAESVKTLMERQCQSLRLTRVGRTRRDDAGYDDGFVARYRRGAAGSLVDVRLAYAALLDDCDEVYQGRALIDPIVGLKGGKPYVYVMPLRPE